MDHRVSPAATVCSEGTCAVSPVSCAAAAMESWRRAVLVSCARRAGTASTAARANNATRSERQIVVLLIQRLRERIQRLRLAVGRNLGRGLGARELPAPGPPPAPRPK